MATFTPNQLPNLAGWFEARNLLGSSTSTGWPTVDGTKVAQWYDLSGLNRHMTQATSALQPTWSASGGPMGTPTVLFPSGAGAWLASSAFTAIPQPYTVYLVCRASAIGTPHVFDGVGGSNRCDLFFATDTQLQVYAGNAYQTLWPQTIPFVPQVPSKAETLFRVAMNGASTIAYRNGVAGATVAATPGAQSLTGFTLGAFIGGGGGNTFTGSVSALLVYGALHDSTQAAQVEGYLRSFEFSETRPGVVCDGDSLTYGFTLAQPQAQCYPSILQQLLPTVDVYNTGVSGRPIATHGGTAGMLATAPNAVDPIYRAGRSANVCILFGGVNDLLGISFAADSAATVESNIQAYCAARRAIGWKVCVVTLPPSNYPGTAGTYEASRLSVNTWLRANYASFCDGLIDFGGDPTYGNAANTGTTTTDGLHFTAAGHAALAAMAAPVVSALAPSSGGFSRARLVNA